MTTIDVSKVKFKHVRDCWENYNWWASHYLEYAPTGGFTIAYIDTPDGTLLGVARCSENERFEKKIGREIALNRLLNNPLKHEDFISVYTDEKIDLHDPSFGELRMTELLGGDLSEHIHGPHEKRYEKRGDK